MDETFYGVLGVDADADEAGIRSAYRDRVKESHPDVSDDPDAPERFRRLTTARDVLLDADERARYDRLGHATYVREAVDDSSWAVQHSPESAVAPRQRAAPEDASTPSTAASQSPPTWLGTDWQSDWDGEPVGTSATGHDREHTATHGTQAWQRASRAYRRTNVTPPAGESRLQALGRGLRKVGGWALVHLVFVLSGVLVVWVAYSMASRDARLSLLTLLAGAVVLLTVVTLSVLHVVSRLYT